MKVKVFCVAVLLFSAFTYAQRTYSTLSGKVVAGDTALPGVTITLEGIEMQGSRTAVTDDTGSYRIVRIPPGTQYVLTATMAGFKTYKQPKLQLQLGLTTTVNINLESSAVEEVITVTAEAPLVDTQTSTISVNMTSEFLKTLTTDRQYQMVMAMTPGALEGNNPSMMGGTSSDNVYLVDGADTTDAVTGTWAAAINFDTIKEIQVMSGGVSAEYGRFQGSVVNSVTKSGGNQFHGNVRFIKSDLDWHEEHEGKPGSSSTMYTGEARWAGTVGGPIIKDKLWFFTSYETRGKERTTFTYPNYAAYITRDSANQVPHEPTYEGHYLNLKLTYQLTENQSLVAQYSEDPIDFPNAAYRGYTSRADPFEVDQQQGGHTATFEYNWVVTQNSILTIAANRNEKPLNQIGSERTSIDNPAINTYTQNGYWYSNDISPSHNQYRSIRNFDQYRINYDMFFNTGMGTHNLKVGGEYRTTESGSLSRNHNGAEGAPGYRFYSYTHSSYANRASRFYIYHDQDLPYGITYQDYYALFAQDAWAVNDNLTINLGLRTEDIAVATLDKRVITEAGFSDMFSPRVGFAWDIQGSSLHGSVSRYYDAPSASLANMSQPGRSYEYDRYDLIYSGNELMEMGLSPWTNHADYEQISFANHPELWEYYTTYTGGTSGGDPDIRNWNPSFMDEFTVGYDRQLGNLYAAGIKYVNREWKDANEDVDEDQDYEYTFQTFDRTWRKYNALILTLQKRLGPDGFQFLASYTYSKNEGISTGNATSVLLDNAYVMNPDLFWGRRNDVPNQFKFNGSYTFDFGLLIGLNYRLMDGYAVTPYLSVENIIPETDKTGNIHNLSATDVGSDREPQWSRADLHLEYELKFLNKYSVSIYADAFNAMNDRSEFAWSNWLGAGTFDIDITAEDLQAEYDAGGNTLLNQYKDFIYNNRPIPIPGEENSTYRAPTSYQFPRSYYFGINFVF